MLNRIVIEIPRLTSGDRLDRSCVTMSRNSRIDCCCLYDRRGMDHSPKKNNEKSNNPRKFSAFLHLRSVCRACGRYDTMMLQ